MGMKMNYDDLLEIKPDARKDESFKAMEGGGIAALKAVDDSKSLAQLVETIGMIDFTMQLYTNARISAMKRVNEMIKTVGNQ